MRLYRTLFYPFYKLMNVYVKWDRRWKIRRIRHGKFMTEIELQEIYAFRISCYKKDAPYLIPKDMEEEFVEKNYDLNSYHVIARNREGQIVGTLRVLHRPFEMERLSLPQNVQDKLGHYLELSRLVTSQRDQGVGRRLLIRAGIWAIRRTSFKGFTAICKDHRLKMFSRFGFVPKSSFTLNEREGQTYHLIQADFLHITIITMFAYLVKLRELIALRGA